MRKVITNFFIVLPVFVAMNLTGCASTNGIRLTAEINCKKNNLVITNWKGIEVGISEQPVWLKDMTLGKTGEFKNLYRHEIGNDILLPMITVQAQTVETARLLALYDADLQLANFIHTDVNVTSGFNGNNAPVISERSICSGVSGIREIVSFWQELSVQPETDKQIMYYGVYAVDKAVYKKYMGQQKN